MIGYELGAAKLPNDRPPAGNSIILVSNAERFQNTPYHVGNADIPPGHGPDDAVARAFNIGPNDACQRNTGFPALERIVLRALDRSHNYQPRERFGEAFCTDPCTAREGDIPTPGA